MDLPGKIRWRSCDSTLLLRDKKATLSAKAAFLCHQMADSVVLFV
jgi:hypothetical protein